MRVCLKLRWLLLVVSLISLGGSESAMGVADDFRYVTIYKAKPGRSAMYAQFTPLQDSTLLCAFRDSKMGTNPKTGKRTPWAVSGSRIMCIRSADNGRTWTDEPVFIYQDKDNFAYISQGGPGHQAADGTILVPFYVWNALGNSEGGNPLSQAWNFIARSKDNGYTWKCECRSSAPFFAPNNYGGIVHLDDGSLWMVDRCRGYNIDYEKASKGMKDRGCVRIVQSTDDGKTWSHYSYIGYDPTRPKENISMPKLHAQQEPAVIQLPSGKVLMISRPFLQLGVSLDRGRTWKIGPSTLTRKGTSGLCPSICYTRVGPPTGTLLLAYHDRWGEHAKRGGNYISFSHDEGQTWGYPIFIDGGAYPCLYELKKDSGKFLCGYYRSSTLLKGVFFSVPFPTGLRALPGLPDSERLGITVKWDVYNGKGSDEYEYRLYRSTKPEFELTPSTLVCSGKDICSYADEAVEKEQKYYYRIAALKDGKVVNKSWQASAKSGI